jgi:hypothetical protein
MNAQENFCGRCGDWIGPDRGEIRVDLDRGLVETICESCRAVEEHQENQRTE